MLYFCLFVFCVFGSGNGNFYQCDTAKLASEKLCYFVKTDLAPWDLVENVVNRTGADFKRQVVDANGTALNVTPKPWTNGDDEVTVTSDVKGDLWTYALIFEMIAPLRN